MSFGNLTGNFEDPVKPEIEKVDLSSRYLEALTGQNNKHWFVILDEIEEEYEGKNVCFTIRLNWEEIPEGKKSIAANGLKSFLERRKAEGVIVISKAEKEALKKSNNPEYMACYNAFASGVKLEEVD